MASRVLPVVIIMVLLAGCAGTTHGTDNRTSPTNTTVSSPVPEPTDNRGVRPTATNSTTETSPSSQTAAPTTHPTSESNSSTTPTTTPTSTVTSSPDSQSKNTTPPPDTATEPKQESPWGEKTLTVAIKNEMKGDRTFVPLVQNALAYWEENSRQHAGYSINYRLTDAANSDITVSFVPTIKDCGGKRHVEGCAPLIQSNEDVNRPVQIQIRGGYTNESTTQLLIHELGHTLGLDHGDAPKKIMAAESDLTTRARPNVTERALPWDHSTLTVAVDSSTVPDSKRGAVNKQIQAALNYYARGASGTVPERVSFRRVSNSETADIVIRFSQNTPCTGLRSGSCSVASGYDPDDDGAIETYAGVEITLTKVDTNTVAWHIANRIGEDAFGFDEPSDFPKPLRNSADSSIQQSNWWAK
jgi:hypothetical protein